MKHFLAALPFVLALGPGAALADGDACNAPRDQWQAETSLRQQLEASGWTIRRIKIEDGCYEVHALDVEGRRLEVHFDPVTLAPVGPGRHG